MSLTFRCAWHFATSTIVSLIAAALWVTVGAGGSIFDKQGYAPKINSVGIRLLGPAVSLTAFTAIWCYNSLVPPPISSVMITYALQRGVWYLSTVPMELAALTGTHFVHICQGHRAMVQRYDSTMYDVWYMTYNKYDVWCITYNSTTLSHMLSKHVVSK